MKLPKNPIQSLESQRESIIQKQILFLQKEILDWVSKDSFSTLNQKEILLRINVRPNSYHQKISNQNEVNALDSRLKFISLTSERLEKLFELHPIQTTFQKQSFLIRKAIVYLDTMLQISKKLLLISKSMTTGKPIDLQFEVNALIDEVDRLASTAEYNHMRLFEGDFAKNSRVASLWFINELNEKLFRVCIATMTSRSLGLTLNNGNPLTLSNPVLFQKKIEGAINTIIEERNRMQSVLN
ncbi:flagellar filament core protein flaB2 domain protein [Leptospira harrisiae]|uniref:Flagellar filament core protein flaB2 domain protein n=1 Tax=Leptospira harrisiae TaxID=2023189 RepID=A0A2N0AI26_9LEPT|nr:flagellar filament core protein flaB2 domain protein [Leptospira harrisiae]PJZ83956.1 flagellar filament core protein flaB2 domain protein [Leptospira harrisiae]PKA07586.1 flagellar filament core protein flaB2 domain protein [Leptospira harrisiae]